MSVGECLSEVQEWTRADRERRQELRCKVETERVIGDAEIARIGLEAAQILTAHAVPNQDQLNTTVSHRVNGMTAHTVVLGPAGWTLPDTGFGVSLDGRLLQVWVCCTNSPNQFSWRRARSWHPTDATTPGHRMPKLALWVHHDIVCLNERHEFQPLEEVVAFGINRLLARQPVARPVQPRLPAAMIRAASLTG